MTTVSPVAAKRDRPRARPAPPDPQAVDPAPAEPLRIAFLSYRSDPRVGGQGVYLAQAAQALAARGHTVDVISGPPYPELSGRVRLIKLQSLDLYAQPHHGHYALRPRHLLSWADASEYFGHLAGRFVEPYAFARRAAHHLRRHACDYDVAIDNQTLGYGLLDIVGRTGLPLVEVIHHPIRRDLELALQAEPRWTRRLLIRQWHGFLGMQERVARRLPSVITVSEASARDIARHLGVRPEAITVIAQGIDQTLFRPRPEIARAPAMLLTTASSDVPLKGLAVLLRAYASLLATRPALELTVIGRLREGATADLLDGLDLRGRVRFVSGLSNEEMAQAYARATLCVTPSLYEGFGLPAAEAMACASPVVVSDGGALPEVVGEAGVVVPRGDPEALALAIGALLDDPARRARLGALAQRRAAELFTWARAGEAYEAALRRAIAAARC